MGVYNKTRTSAKAAAVAEMIIGAKNAETTVGGWRLEYRVPSNEFFITDVGRCVELVFNARRDDGRLTLLNTHRLSRIPRQGNGTAVLKEFEEYVGLISLQERLEVLIRFDIRGYKGTEPFQSMQWVRKNGYVDQNGREERIFEKRLRYENANL